MEKMKTPLNNAFLFGLALCGSQYICDLTINGGFDTLRQKKVKIYKFN